MRREVITCDACLKTLNLFDTAVGATLTSKAGTWGFDLCSECWNAGRPVFRTLWQRIMKKNCPNENELEEKK